MPRLPASSRLISASIGKGRFFSSSLSRRHARCTNSLSMLTPRICASRALNSLSSLPKAAISVGQTKVKSLGQKNTTCHLPGKLSWVKGSNARAASLDTTPVRANSGKRWPMPDMLGPLFGNQWPHAGRGAILRDELLSIQSIDLIISIDAIYRAAGHRNQDDRGTEVEGPALPGRGGRPAPLRPRRRALLRQPADPLLAAEEARAEPRSAADRARPEQRLAHRGRRRDRGARPAHRRGERRGRGARGGGGGVPPPGGGPRAAAAP